MKNPLQSVSISDWLALALVAVGLGAAIGLDGDLRLLAVFVAGYGLGRVRFGRAG